MYVKTELHTKLAAEIASAKANIRGWYDEFEDSRLEAGACDRSTVERLAAEAPSAFVAGWVSAMLPSMLMEQR